MAFRIEKHTTVDKHFMITGPIELSVDYDDVNHGQQDRLAKRVVKILNAHWEESGPITTRQAENMANRLCEYPPANV